MPTGRSGSDANRSSSRPRRRWSSGSNDSTAAGSAPTPFGVGVSVEVGCGVVHGGAPGVRGGSSRGGGTTKEAPGVPGALVVEVSDAGVRSPGTSTAPGCSGVVVADMRASMAPSVPDRDADAMGFRRGRSGPGRVLVAGDEPFGEVVTLVCGDAVDALPGRGTRCVSRLDQAVTPARATAFLGPPPLRALRRGRPTSTARRAPDDDGRVGLHSDGPWSG